MKVEYDNRDIRLAESDLYSYFNPSYAFMRQHLLRSTISMIKKHGIKSLSNYKIFELGCGKGGILLDLLSIGAKPTNLIGIDLIKNRIDHAYEILPSASLVLADGRKLPFQEQIFDIVMQFTVFSSVLNKPDKQFLAKELIRVLRQPNGLILWYDFWLNPTNDQTHGIRPKEIKELFPGCVYDFRVITLAPPIARKLVPISWGLSSLLENMRLFNTHYLAIIQPKTTG